MMNIERDPLLAALKATAYEVKGIVPLDALYRDSRALDAERLLREEAPTIDPRVTKRKFRKAWRKEARRLVAAARPAQRNGVARYVARDMGKGSVPTRSQKLGRRRAVMAAVHREAALAKAALMSHG